MNMPGFIAEASLYRTRVTYRQRASANSGAGTGAVRAQWDYCSGCSAGESLQFCCDYSGIGLCSWVPCPFCTPGCGPCVLNANSPTRGMQSCWDAHCYPLPSRQCAFCRFRLGYQACYSECSSSCAQTDQACLDNCDCCCNTFNQRLLCTECENGVWTNGHCYPT